MQTQPQRVLHGLGGRPKLALTVGDPSGIGPEIVAAAVRDERVRRAADLVVLGPRVLREEVLGGADLAGIEWLDVDGATALPRVALGQAHVDGGRAALEIRLRGGAAEDAERVRHRRADRDDDRG